MEHKNELNQSDRIHSFLYLFIMDMVRIPFESYVDYEKGEPGFARPFFEAYIAAFQAPKDGRLSHELFKQVNAIALQHLPESSAGDYRYDTGNFAISIEIYDEALSPLYSVTYAGLDEFVAYWLLNHPHPHHDISFHPRSGGLGHHYALLAKEGALVWMSSIERVIQSVPFDSTQHMPLIRALMSRYEYVCTIDTMATQKNIKVLTEQLMQGIFDEFHAEIATAETDDCKIEVIAKHIQRIEQLHPFCDGNIRTCSILMNKLLNDYDLPLTILLNPNKLDCCALDEIVDMVKKGQAIYRQVLENTNRDRLIIHTSENIPQVKRIVCPSQNLNEPELLQAFCDIVLHRPSISASSSLHRLFDFPNQGSVHRMTVAIKGDLKTNRSKKCVSIQKAIEKRNFAVGFRQACAAGEYGIIDKMLPFVVALRIDLGQQSSNGNTALDWFDLNTQTPSVARTATRERLTVAGAINITVKKQSEATDVGLSPL